MLSIFTLSVALPWRLITASALASVLFIGGCRFGERRITTQWTAEKIASAQAVALQTIHVANVTEQQTIINQKVIDEFNKTKAQLTADSQRLLARVPLRVRVESSNGDSTMPSFSVGSAGVTSVTADPVPSSAATCEKLTQDATETMLMVLSFQRWYAEQSKVQSQTTAP